MKIQNQSNSFIPVKLYLFAILSATLIVLSFPPFNQEYLIWISLVPWLIELNHPAKTYSLKQKFYSGVILSFFMSLGGFYWIATVLTEFAHLPLPLSILCLFLYSLVGQPQFLLFPVLLQFISNKIPNWIHTKNIQRNNFIYIAAMYCAIEWSFPKLFTDTLGHSQYQKFYLSQIADIGTPMLITFFVLIVNLEIGNFFSYIQKQKRVSIASFKLLIPTLILFILANIYGFYRVHTIEKIIQEESKTYNVGVIQANIGDFDKVAAETGGRFAAKKILNTFYQMTDLALKLTPKPDFVVWPETSYPSSFGTADTLDEKKREDTLIQFVKDRNIPLLFGGYDTNNGNDYNSFFYINPLERVENFIRVYHKNKLLLFGEYIPGAEYFPWIKQQFPQVGHFGRGEGPRVIPLVTSHGILKTGPVICYEILFPEFVRKAKNLGSEVIINITNDSWFGNNSEPHLHLALTVFRSIESRIPHIRSTNTGISASIDALGRINKQSELFKPEVLPFTFQVLENPIHTIFTRFGDWFGPFCIGFVIFFSLYKKIKMPNQN